MLMRTWRVQDLTSSMMAHLRLSFNNEQASDERVRHPQCRYINTLRSLLLVHNALAFFWVSSRQAMLGRLSIC